MKSTDRQGISLIVSGVLIIIFVLLTVATLVLIVSPGPSQNGAGVIQSTDYGGGYDYGLLRLQDGRIIECLRWAGLFRGGLSCNWQGAK